MGCANPIPAYQSGPGIKPKLWATEKAANLWVGCGRCLQCRADYAQQWATRAVHEAQEHDINGFWTITYRDSALPPDRGLVPRHLSLFWGRVRISCVRRPDLWLGDRLRYVACGEYGTRTKRPHYHAIVFGLMPRDAHRPDPKALMHSELLDEIWGLGSIGIGTFSKASAQYVAQYTIKAQQREYADEDGVVLHRPFLRASRRPAIGLSWLERFAPDLSQGFALADTDAVKIPRYYRKKLAELYPDLSAVVEAQIRNAIAKREQPTQQQNEAAEAIKASYRALHFEPKL